MTFQVTDPISGSTDGAAPGAVPAGEENVVRAADESAAGIGTSDRRPDQAGQVDQSDRSGQSAGDGAASDGTAGNGMVFTVAAVARRLGVAPSTLRTWARRYGLGPSSHEVGTHRRYTERDLSRLQAMRRLTLAGMPAADAARAVLSGEAPLPATAVARPRRTAAGTGFVPPSQRGGQADAHPGRVVDVRDSVLSWADGEPIERGLFRAAAALDAGATGEIVRRAVAEHGALGAWDRLIRPVLRDIGRRWDGSPEGQAIERVAAYAIDSALRERVQRVPEPAHSRPLLVAGAPGQPTTLPLAVLAAALAESDVRVRQLGADVQPAVLEAAVRRTGACAVLVYAETTDDVALSATLGRLPLTRPRTDIFAGGPGWSVAGLPRRVRHVRDVADAVSALLQSVAH